MAVSYYKVIEGKRYDRQMLKVVEEAAAGQQEKQIPLGAIKRLYVVMVDGNRITAIERSTLEYLKDKFTFDPAAEKWLAKKVAAWEKKKQKKKRFSLNIFRLLRSDPIVQSSKPPKKPKKKSRPTPPKTKVTIDFKSIGKKPKRPVTPKEEAIPPHVSPVTAEEADTTEQPAGGMDTFAGEHGLEDLQAITPSDADQIPPTQEGILEANDEQQTEDPGDGTEEMSSTFEPTPHLGSSIKPIEQVLSGGKAPSVPSPRPSRQLESSSWKWYAIVCLLLVPVSFLVGRGFEPIRFNIADENRPQDLHTILQAQDHQIATLQKEIESLKTNRDDNIAEVQSVSASVSAPQEIKKAETKRKISTALTDQLSNQFSTNLIQFDRERLWLTFKPSESYFNGGSSKLNPSLKRALRKFFPNFVKTLMTFEDDISEIRFQGHSSSDWRNVKNPSEAFLKNLRLSNARAESALRYCLGLKEVARHKAWLEKRMVSSGFSYQKPVLTQNQNEDPVKSRRITIAVGIAAPKQ